MNCPLFGHPTIVGAAAVTGHRRFCELLDPAHPDYAPAVEPRYREMTAGLNGVAPEAAGVRATRTHGAGPSPSVRTIPVAESLRRLKLARECEHRTDPRCGCAGMATCLLGKGRDGQVSLSECVECVAGRDAG